MGHLFHCDFLCILQIRVHRARLSGLHRWLQGNNRLEKPLVNLSFQGVFCDKCAVFTNLTIGCAVEHGS